MEIALTCLIGYLCGCFLTAVIVSKKFTGKDVSQIAEGNPGMANVMINIGKKPGFIVLFGDILKVAVAYTIVYFLFYKTLGSKVFFIVDLVPLLVIIIHSGVNLKVVKALQLPVHGYIQ